MPSHWGSDWWAIDGGLDGGGGGEERGPSSRGEGAPVYHWGIEEGDLKAKGLVEGGGGEAAEQRGDL